jgi:hypothetical protein
MTAQVFLHDLIAHGANFMADDGQLDIDAPDELLTDDLLAALRERKAELLELLTRDSDENPEMHDSALFDVVVEVDFYDGRRIRIPQRSTPEGWEAPF